MTTIEGTDLHMSTIAVMSQRLAALEIANSIRSRRADFKRDLKAGRESARLLLLDPPDWAETMQLIDVLLAVPRVGRVTAARWLRRADVPPSKKLSDMTPRQRLALAVVLEGL